MVDGYEKILYLTVGEDYVCMIYNGDKEYTYVEIPNVQDTVKSSLSEKGKINILKTIISTEDVCKEFKEEFYAREKEDIEECERCGYFHIRDFQTTEAFMLIHYVMKNIEREKIVFNNLEDLEKWIEGITKCKTDIIESLTK